MNVSDKTPEARAEGQFVCEKEKSMGKQAGESKELGLGDIRKREDGVWVIINNPPPQRPVLWKSREVIKNKGRDQESNKKKSGEEREGGQNSVRGRNVTNEEKTACSGWNGVGENTNQTAERRMSS